MFVGFKVFFIGFYVDNLNVFVVEEGVKKIYCIWVFIDIGDKFIW